MDASKLDRQKEEQLKKEEARQNAEAIARHYGDIKRGVAMVQDAANSGTKILNSHLLNLLEEPLEKLQKLIEYIDPIEYSDNLVKQKGYLVSSLDKLDASLKERVGGIIGQFDFLIGRLSSDVEKHEMHLGLLKSILNCGAEFDIDEYAVKGIDFNEMVDASKISSEYSWIEKISVLGACILKSYPKKTLIRLLSNCADANKICLVSTISGDPDGSHFCYYPLGAICNWYDDRNGIPLNDAEFLKDLARQGIDLNGFGRETYYDNFNCHDNKESVLLCLFFLRDHIKKYDEDELAETIGKLKNAGLNLNCSANTNLIYYDTGEKLTITDWLLSKHPLKRKIHKLFIGCDFDKNPILKEVTRAKIYGSYNGYLESKNYLLFLINNDVDALSDFSYRLRYSNGDSSFTGSLIGLFVFDAYDSRNNGSEVYGKLRRDLTELLLRLKIDLDWVALKYENGNEASFRAIMNQS